MKKARGGSGDARALEEVQNCALNASIIATFSDISQQICRYTVGKSLLIEAIYRTGERHG